MDRRSIYRNDFSSQYKAIESHRVRCPIYQSSLKQYKKYGDYTSSIFCVFLPYLSAHNMSENNTADGSQLQINIKKRDGSEDKYDEYRIACVVDKAMKETNEKCKDEDRKKMVLEIGESVKKYVEKHESIGVEEIQDIVEETLMMNGYYETSKKFIKFRMKRNEQRRYETYISKIKDDIKPQWGPLGYVTYKRTYSRRINDEDKTEEYRDTVLRVLDACQRQLNVGFTNRELRKAYEYMMKLKFSVAGRFLWQLGTKTVDKLGLMSLQNCAFVKIDNPIRPFLWVFDVLMLGTGVGINIQRENVDQLPPVLNVDIEIKRNDAKDADYIVPDSREGWVSLLEEVLEAFFYKGRSFTYSTILIRGAGSKISGFGGTASGPDYLVNGIDQIVKILSKRKGCKLSPTDCMDIVCNIGTIVVSGNVRRSAIICLGDCDDEEYLNAKNWALGTIPNWRAMSNNSVVCNDINTIPESFWNTYDGSGECYGLINIGLSRRVGRTKDGEKYPDPTVCGYNPCAEISLSNFETCCLSEIFLPNIESLKEMKDVCEMAYRICKHSLTIQCHHKETEDVVKKNMRIGIGITGYMQCSDEKKKWLSEVYTHLRKYDETYSSERGMPTSVKLTTVKPSGTLSLLAGCTSGAHPGIFQYFIRRIRVSSTNQDILNRCRKNGYHIEYQRNFDGTEDKSTMVIEFACKYPEGTKLAKDMSAIDQLETIKTLQREWSDNSVSVTIYYRKEELDDIKRWLKENYNENIKTVSFMLHFDHCFSQAPFEEITKEEYERRKLVEKEITEIDNTTDNDLDYTQENCKGGVCPIR